MAKAKAGPGPAAQPKKGGHKKSLTGRQKAAIFLVTLGSEISSEIFKHLREDEIEQLTFEIARLDKIEPDEKDKVLQEFQEMMMAQEFISQGGIDYARDVLERALGTQKAIDIVNRLTSSIQVRPFDFIRRTDPSHLLNFIQGEHPQTIALILVNLNYQTAAEVIQLLPETAQSEVVVRIAELDNVPDEIVEEIQEVIMEQIADIAAEKGWLPLFDVAYQGLGDGLEEDAVGLRVLLAKLTKNRFMAAITGAIVTGICQSSSVTTVLLVGFISAGLMTLQQAIGVIMGANIGSTVSIAAHPTNLPGNRWPPMRINPHAQATDSATEW